MTKPTRVVLCAALAPLFATGCATLGNLHGSTVKSDEITARNQAVEAAAATPLAACATKGKPEDSGAFGVSAAADGTLSVDAVQWSGSDDGRKCLLDEAAKAKLPPWGGGVTSAIWAFGTNDHPAPKPLAEEPPGFRSRMTRQMVEMFGQPDMGPMATCVQQNISVDAYAVVNYRMVVFPDGKVASVTPLSIDGEGRDVGFQDCMRKLITQFTFDPFPGPSYYFVSVPIKKGVDTSSK